jgi:hypothetical protein
MPCFFDGVASVLICLTGVSSELILRIVPLSSLNACSDSIVVSFFYGDRFLVFFTDMIFLADFEDSRSEDGCHLGRNLQLF